MNELLKLKTSTREFLFSDHVPLLVNYYASLPTIAQQRQLTVCSWIKANGAPKRRNRISMAVPLSTSPLSRTRRVLSIQSHTVHGYVGNKSAVFPLQLLGFDVDPINSVHFSNHTGYPTIRGQALNGEELLDLIEGLESNELLYYTHLLTGYIGSISFLETILQVLEKLRSINPNLIYVCDPVMGDEGKLYVKPQLVPAFRDKVISLANLLTPNQFEAELLTGIGIQTEVDALKAINALHAVGPSQVVITSLDVDGKLHLLGSHLRKGEAAQQFRITMEKIPAYFTGTGDLMTALLLGWSHKYPDDLAKAAELAVASLQGVLKRTFSDYEEVGVAPNLKHLELRLIQSQSDITLPQYTRNFVNNSCEDFHAILLGNTQKHHSLTQEVLDRGGWIRDGRAPLNSVGNIQSPSERLGQRSGHRT